MITPGNLPASSGTAVTVSPSATTTYTLTVTPTSGAAATQTVTVTVDPAPTITSFNASPLAIASGGSASLTGVFAGGTGVITPGNLSAASGTAVTVSPAATTTYTLTVTNPTGTAVTQTATVTVVPPPTITSFAAGQATISAGASTNLTGIFAGGTGLITPGNIPVASGTPVSVSPATTTVYTLTVTNLAGAPVTLATTVTVVPSPAITSFVATNATIVAGSSTNLTGVFADGTGVITPGNLSVTSGTPVSVSPSATTTYTLTATNAAGTAVTQTATVTVIPAPTITSFTASSPTITTGGSTNLTGVFANGTGVITPGDLTATSGAAVSVSPTTTTTYTLTVTPSTGAAVTQTVTVTVVPAPTITSFTASPATITAGASANLTGVFPAGTGVITPGNLAAASGTPVSVSPSVTTTYTLTVTNDGGTTVTKTFTVTVDPAPTITSFTSNLQTISAGGSTKLTGVFGNGTGVITPGNLAATSGTAVTVSPGTTTTYTLTVTNPVGTAATMTVLVTVTPPPTSNVTVNQSSSGPALTDLILGMNLPAWYDVTSTANEPAIQSAFAAAGIKGVRWPGGGWSDAYNWETNKECGNTANTNDDFTDFINKLVIPAGLNLALTADYGTGKNCTGPGDPTEAAAWASASASLGVTVSYMTVGNEEYGSWEVDHHSQKNNSTTYAAAVAGSSGYYALIKAASPNTLVGVDVEPTYGSWDKNVLSGAPYDFVEYHFYPETPGEEDDTFLVHSAAQELTTNLNTIKAELTTAGKTGTPIYVGEIGGPYSNPGQQSWSITQGLYAGQVLGEMMNDGVARLTWWIGFGNCNGNAGYFDPSLYGWQSFGGYNIFSDGAADPTCPGAGPAGTMSPTARAFQLFKNVAVNGEFALTASVTGNTTDVKAYAATNSGGTALVLFNRNENIPEPVTITLSAQSTANSVTVETYDKAIYDQTNATPPVWAAPTTTDLGAQSLPLTLTLTPWSMNVVMIH